MYSLSREEYPILKYRDINNFSIETANGNSNNAFQNSKLGKIKEKNDYMGDFMLESGSITITNKQ